MTIYFKNGFYDDTLGSVPEGAVAVGAKNTPPSSQDRRRAGKLPPIPTAAPF